MIVMKFGGTSCGDVTGMKNIVRIVRNGITQKPVVIVSAIARATNELEQIARTAALGEPEQANELTESLIRRHHSLVTGLLNEGERRQELTQVINRQHAALGELVRGLAVLRKLPLQSMDAVCSFGERLSSRIVAAALAEAGIVSSWIDAREFMLTDANFGRARPIMHEVRKRLESVVRPVVDAGSVAVTQGFIGVTESGDDTTMGRESSDYTATVIGGLMQAGEVQIWTDVNGIRTADPRTVPGTLTVTRVSYEEAVQLSHGGAKVLHPTTMMPLLEQDIPLRILNSRSSEQTGTLVEVHSVRAERVVKSIAQKRNCTIISVTPRKRHGQHLFWEGAVSVLSKHGVAAIAVTSAEYSLGFLVEDASITVGLIQDLEQIGFAQISRDKGLVTLVGDGMTEASEVTGTTLGALKGIDILMMVRGASDSALALVVPLRDLQEAVNRLHKAFFGDRSEEPLFEESAETAAGV